MRVEVDEAGAEKQAPPVDDRAGRGRCAFVLIQHKALDGRELPRDDGDVGHEARAVAGVDGRASDHEIDAHSAGSGRRKPTAVTAIPIPVRASTRPKPVTPSSTAASTRPATKPSIPPVITRMESRAC